MMNTHPILPDTDQLTVVHIGLSPKWHKLLFWLQQLERQGAQISIVQFTQRGPRVLEVSKLED